METEMTDADIPGIPNCAFHPGIDSTGQCVGCGRYLCDQCATIVKGSILCGTCARPKEETILDLACEAAFRDHGKIDEFHTIFLNTTLYVPTSNIPDSTGVRWAKDGEVFSPIIYKEEGTMFLMAFDDLNKLRARFPRETGYVGLAAHALIESWADPRVHLWLNPVTNYAHNFQPDEIEYLKNRILSSSPQKTAIPPDTKVMIGEPKVVPPNLLSRLNDFCKRNEEITDAFLGLVYFALKDEKPGLYLVLKLDSMETPVMAAIQKELAIVIQESLPEGEYINMAFYDGTGIQTDLVRQVKPFYRKIQAAQTTIPPPRPSVVVPESGDLLWYVNTTEGQQGPFTLNQLRDWYSNKELSDDHYIWCPDWPDWKRVGEIKNTLCPQPGVTASAAEFYEPFKESHVNFLYNILFCDNIELFRNEKSVAGGHPWDVLLTENPDINALTALANSEREEGRVRALAFNRLRSLGRPVPPRKILGVVIEVHLQGLDVLAAFADGGVRYLNQSGKIAVFEEDCVPAVKARAEELLMVSESVVGQIGPLDRKRLPPPASGRARMTLIVSDGLYLGDGPIESITRDEIGGPVFAKAAQLLEAVVQACQK